MPSTDSSSTTPGTMGTASARDAAKQAAETVREHAGEMAGHVKQQAESMLEGQKQIVAERIEGVADALRDTASRLDKEVHGNLSGYADRAIRGLDNAAEALRSRDIGTLVADLESFARRQPALFLAGSVVAGFALARFLKSSSRARGRAGDAHGYDAGTDTLARDRSPTPVGYYQSPSLATNPTRTAGVDEAQGRTRRERW